MPIFAISFKNGAVVTLTISGFTGPILIKFAHDAVTILPLNILKNRNCHISTRFQRQPAE